MVCKRKSTFRTCNFLLLAQTIVGKGTCFVPRRRKRERGRGNVDWKRKGYLPSQDILIRYFNTNLLKYQPTSDIAAIHCT